jgi:hypothetical protein
MAKNTIRIDVLLSEFGKSMLEAQAQPNAVALEHPPDTEGLQTGVAISETEIDVKMIFEEDDSGVSIRPVSAGVAGIADLDPGVFSSIHARLVAVPDEEVRPPTRKPPDIRAEVFDRPDIQRLKNIFGDLMVETTYVSAAGRWLVDVKEPEGMVLRSIQISDIPE